MGEIHMSSFRSIPILGLMAVAALSLPGLAGAQAVHYAGKVVDDAGKGIDGALIVLEGSSFSAQTGADGSFDLNGTLSGVRPGLPGRNPARLSDAGSGRSALRRADGRLQARGAFAYGILLSRPGAERVTPAIPMAKRAGTPSPAADAAYILVVTKAGHLAGRFSQSRVSAHAHFGAVDPNPADAENELPGWPLKDYKTVSAIMVKGTKMMWDEGPGGGHYENIKGSHTTVGCGIHITAAGDVWIVQDFR